MCFIVGMGAPRLTTKGNEMANASRFQRGSGVYKCGCCGRATRATGRGDNENNGLCAECYDLAGYENEVSDYGVDSLSDSSKREMMRLYALIAEKGGDNSSFSDVVQQIG